MDQEILEWYRYLIALRKQRPELTDGRFDRVEVEFDENEKCLTLQRGGVTCACNFAKDTVEISVRETR